MESDRIGLRGGLNTYNYLSRNPLGNKDFYGLSTCPPGDVMCDIAMNASGMPQPTPPVGSFDAGVFSQCLIFGKLFETISVTAGIHGTAKYTAGTVLEEFGAGADMLSKNPMTIGIGALYGMDYCWRHAHIKGGCPLGSDWTDHSPLFQGVPW